MSPFNPLPSFHLGLPDQPTRDEILAVKLSFQGMVVPTKAYGNLPWFEACLPWLTAEDRQSAYTVKRQNGDTHCILTLPDGPPLYDEPNQPYNSTNFPPLDWTSNNTIIDQKFFDLIVEVLTSGFPNILLYLGGDGPANASIAFKQLDLLRANDYYNRILSTYCVVGPGWDSVFYGWEPSLIQEWSNKFRAYWPHGYCFLEHDIGHIPLGEGGGDFQPGGRMQNFDLILSEYDNNLHQDSCWQINGRLEKPYIRPSDQPVNDDPNPPFYLGSPSPRGKFYHCAFEFGEYEFVRGGCSQASIDYVNANRKYLKDMGCVYTG